MPSLADHETLPEQSDAQLREQVAETLRLACDEHSDLRRNHLDRRRPNKSAPFDDQEFLSGYEKSLPGFFRLLSVAMSTERH